MRDAIWHRNHFLPILYQRLDDNRIRAGLRERPAPPLRRAHCPPTVPTHTTPVGGDANGYSHMRASLMGPSLTIPFVEARLTLGTWQQIIFIDFDNRPRRRELIMQVIGE